MTHSPFRLLLIAPSPSVVDRIRKKILSDSGSSDKIWQFLDIKSDPDPKKIITDPQHCLLLPPQALQVSVYCIPVSILLVVRGPNTLPTCGRIPHSCVAVSVVCWALCRHLPSFNPGGVSTTPAPPPGAVPPPGSGRSDSATPWIGCGWIV
jgi:hypothetical protein